ncbi:hypothetical protein [Sphingomonas faeni]|uniref:hypothetical protein n=1 Tax=Sphingomonas faeni TaxID=185950 RepID=UPI003360F2B3
MPRVRKIPPALQAEIEKDVVRPFFAVGIDLPDPVFIWTGSGEISFADADWVGIGSEEGKCIGSLESIGESTDGSAPGVKVTIVGIPSEHRDHIEEQAVRGADFRVYIGALNETRQIVQAYKLLTRAKLDSYQIVDGVDLSVIVTGESRMLDQRRPSIKRYTDAAQQKKYPGDRFFEYMPQLPSIPILWAKAKQDAVL